jgi:predicted secreted hydrolase
VAVPPPQPVTPGSFDVAAGAIRARGGGGRDAISGQTADYRLDLSLSESKPPVLHGQTGYIGVSEAESSYYYSRSRMAATGTLWDRGIAVPVTGEAWMDHQWGDFTLEGEGGWDWFAAQLDSGTDLMLTVLRGAENRIVLAYGTLIDPAGRAQHVPAGGFRVRALDSWTSPATGVTYPMGWQVDLPDQGLALRIDPVLPEQEMNTQASVGRGYWEGQVHVSGTAGGSPITGMGYVELTGYERGKR